MPIVEAAPLSEVTNPILYSARAGESEAAASTAAVTPAINPARIIAMIHSSDLLRRNEDAPARERAPLEPISPIQRHFGLAHKQAIADRHGLEPGGPHAAGGGVVGPLFALRAALHPVSPRRRSRRSWF